MWALARPPIGGLKPHGEPRGPAAASPRTRPAPSRDVTRARDFAETQYDLPATRSPAQIAVLSNPGPRAPGWCAAAQAANRLRYVVALSP
jgi:hypothetical protein